MRRRGGRGEGEEEGPERRCWPSIGWGEGGREGGLGAARRVSRQLEGGESCVACSCVALAAERRR